MSNHDERRFPPDDLRRASRYCAELYDLSPEAAEAVAALGYCTDQDLAEVALVTSAITDTLDAADGAETTGYGVAVRVRELRQAGGDPVDFLTALARERRAYREADAEDVG